MKKEVEELKNKLHQEKIKFVESERLKEADQREIIKLKATMVQYEQGIILFSMKFADWCRIWVDRGHE